ncbi:hypothetical protein MBANPS3_009484, partial [Mucor bainieri]
MFGSKCDAAQGCKVNMLFPVAKYTLERNGAKQATVFLSTTKSEEKNSTEHRNFGALYRLSKKKQDDKLKFSSDRSAVDWDSLVDLIDESKLSNLSRKRRSSHTDLHLQEDACITELIESSAQPRDQVDRLFMGVDDELNIPKLTSAVTNWMEKAHHVKELHKQDLLCYRIMDFTTSDSSAGVYSILKDKYSLAKHYYCSFQNDIGKAMEDGCDDVKGYASSVFKKK